MKPSKGQKILDSHGGNNYDMHFVQEKSGYSLYIFMKVQFFFKKGSGGKWTGKEKKDFVRIWARQVSGKWSTNSLISTKAGKKIALKFQFETQIEGWMWDHWELTVEKLKPGDFEVSWVSDGWLMNDSALDSGDIRVVAKGHGQSQRASVHEFGHMLGLDDEYLKGGKHVSDYRSIMNRGEVVYPRHFKKFQGWATWQVKKHKIL